MCWPTVGTFASVNSTGPSEMVDCEVRDMPVVILLILVLIMTLVVAGPLIERGIDRLWPPAGDDPEPSVRNRATSAGASPARPS